MNQRVSVFEAAAEIGCHPQYLRQQMRTGKWDLGIVVKPPCNCSRFQYFIFRAKLDKFLGKEQEETLCSDTQ